MQHPNRNHRCPRRGATLIEVVMATLVTGVILTGALTVLGSALRTRRVAADVNTGARLAEQLLSECISLPYVDPDGAGNGKGPETGESGGSRINFDDIDDYNGYSENLIFDKNQGLITGFDGWSRSVTVTWAERLGGKKFYFYDTSLKRIEVTATAPDGTQTTRYALVSRDGALQQAPAQDSTVATMLAIELEVGNSGQTAHGATSLSNYPTDPNAS